MAEQGFTSHGWLVERRSRQYFVSLESGIIRFSYFRTPEQSSPGFVQSDNEKLKNTFGTPEFYELKYPAASSGVFDPRGSRQISMQAWLPGSLLAGIKRTASVHITVLLRLSASVLVLILFTYLQVMLQSLPVS